MAVNLIVSFCFVWNAKFDWKQRIIESKAGGSKVGETLRPQTWQPGAVHKTLAWFCGILLRRKRRN